MPCFLEICVDYIYSQLNIPKMKYKINFPKCNIPDIKYTIPNTKKPSQIFNTSMVRCAPLAKVGRMVDRWKAWHARSTVNW